MQIQAYDDHYVKCVPIVLEQIDTNILGYALGDALYSPWGAYQGAGVDFYSSIIKHYTNNLLESAEEKGGYGLKIASISMINGEKAKLTLTGDLGKKKIRFGSSANGLTAAQLSQIDYKGHKLILTSDGYLTLPPAGSVILLK